jgi:hypothetical protein
MCFAWFSACLLLGGSVHVLSAEPVPSSSEARGLLQKALEEHGKFEGRLPFADQETLKEWGGVSGEYEQMTEPDGVRLRKLTLRDGHGREMVCMIQNRDGVFVGVDGKWWQGPGLYPLYIYDLLADPFPEEEWGMSNFAMEEIVRSGRKLLRITMRLPDDFAKLLDDDFGRKLDVKSSSAKKEDLKDPAYSRRPVTRVFFLDPQSGRIVYRAHYNARGEKCFELAWPKQEDFTVPRTEDFQLNGPVVGREYVLKDMMISRTRELQKDRHLSDRGRLGRKPVWRTLVEHRTPILAACGVLLLGAAFALRRHRDKDFKR